MLGFHERRKLKRYLFSHVSLLVLLVAVCSLAWSVWGMAVKERETRLKRDELLAEKAKLEERSVRLGEEIERLTTERGIEAELRSKFEVGKPGEKLILIVDPEIPLEQESHLEREGFWGWLTGWFR